MKRFRLLLSVLLVLSLGLATLSGGCAPVEAAELKVVTSTSLIAQIVERIGGERVSVVNIIPPAQCPGHFDVKPGDVQKLADADLFLLHGWQGEKFTDELIASADNPDLAVTQINAKVGENANWMTPSVQAAAVGKIADALCQLDQGNADAYRDAAASYEQIISEQEEAVKESIARLNPADVNVMCAEQQAGFINWAGFNIVSTFGRPDSMTPQVVKELVDKGQAGGVVLIIDNMQSGADAGAGLAEELGCARVILSNFPGCYDGTDTWEKAIEYNVELLADALGK
jgi:zinc transport system substrate-binding protein